MTRPPPLFVLGSPRSGTTLLRLMLTCHPSIVIPPECGFAQWLHAKWGGWTPDDARSRARVAAFVGDLIATRKWETWRLPAEEVVAGIEAERPADYAALVSSVYGSYARAKGKPTARWGDKNNYYLHHVAQLRGLFPDCVLVHIVRDGRDVACSYVELAGRTMASDYAPRLPSELADIALDWVDNVSMIRRSFEVEGWRGVVELRYEDLVTRPEETLSTLLASFGETYDPRMLDYAARNQREQLEPEAFLQWKARTTEAPDAARIGRFRRELNKAQIQLLNTKMGPLLTQYDYALD